MAASVKGGDLDQGIADILSEFADIIYCGAPGERDPTPFVEAAEEFVFDHLRLEYPDAPESDLREAAHGALLDYEVGDAAASPRRPINDPTSVPSRTS